jgi:hypothetical protein
MSNTQIDVNDLIDGLHKDLQKFTLDVIDNDTIKSITDYATSYLYNNKIFDVHTYPIVVGENLIIDIEPNFHTHIIVTIDAISKHNRMWCLTL